MLSLPRQTEGQAIKDVSEQLSFQMNATMTTPHGETEDKNKDRNKKKSEDSCSDCPSKPFPPGRGLENPLKKYRMNASEQFKAVGKLLLMTHTKAAPFTEV